MLLLFQRINKKLKSQNEEDDYKMPSFKDLVAKENFDFIKNNKPEVKENNEQV